MSVLQSIREDIAAELRAARYWGQTQRLLDGMGTDDLVDTARNLLASANPTERRALQHELGPYLVARGVPTTVSDNLSPIPPR
ncbi:UNVERIFIED_ORG: hypothetical protein L601_000800000380 [Gordonia westfalica J30]